MTAKEFYEKNATNVVSVPRIGHPEDPGGWKGVRRASEAQFIAPDVEVMALWDVFDFAEKYAAGIRTQLNDVTELAKRAVNSNIDLSIDIDGLKAGNWSAPSPVGTQSAIQIALETLNREKGELRTQLEEANLRGRKAELLFADQCANVAALVKPLEDQIDELQSELSQRDEDDKLVQNHYKRRH